MKCSMTTHGFRSVSTVTPPMSACAGTPNSTMAASCTTLRRRGSARNAAISTAAASAPTTKVSVRLPNSTTPWMPSSGVLTSDSSVQLGNVGQPSPESVSRTAPPVTTIPICATSEAIAHRRKAGREGRGMRSHRFVTTAPADRTPTS